MKPMKRALALMLVLVCAAVPALAQDRGDSSPLSGYVLAGGMVIPMQPSPETEIMSIWLLGGDLLLDHPEMTDPMAITLADEGRWVIEIDHPDIPEPALTPDDAALAWAGDCDHEDVPRLVVRGNVSMAGAVLNMTLRMLPLDMDTIYAILEIKGAAQGQYTNAPRVVWLNRVEE